jgi:pimeloyl-ACP methyl ester carboxylesterase
LDIFIGGGGDDLAWLGFGVVRQYATHYAGETGRRTVYLPNARIGRARRLIETAARAGETVNVVGHSWGAIDAYVATAAAVRRGAQVANLITLDPISGPLRRPPAPPAGVHWLNVDLDPAAPDPSDRLTTRRPWARKPSRLPLAAADEHVVLDLNHWNVRGMMQLSGARARLDAAHGDRGPAHRP